jgi:hypothetical protein
MPASLAEVPRGMTSTKCETRHAGICEPRGSMSLSISRGSRIRWLVGVHSLTRTWCSYRDSAKGSEAAAAVAAAVSAASVAAWGPLGGGADGGGAGGGGGGGGGGGKSGGGRA